MALIPLALTDSHLQLLQDNQEAIALSIENQHEAAHMLLQHTYHRVTSEGDVAADGSGSEKPRDSVVDQLRSVTLNNLGFAAYQRGNIHEALAFFEESLEIEMRWENVTATLMLNLCVVYGARGAYAEAAQYALRAIGILHSNALTRGASDTDAKLWAAAWHNLGIVQLQAAKPNDRAANTNVWLMFRHAMRASRDLLGAAHPLYATVVNAHRVIRHVLQARGVYGVHETELGCAGRSSGGEELPALHSFRPHGTSPRGMSLRTVRRRCRQETTAIVPLGPGGGRLVEKVGTEPYTPAPPSRDAKVGRTRMSARPSVSSFFHTPALQKVSQCYHQRRPHNARPLRPLAVTHRGSTAGSEATVAGRVEAPRPPSRPRGSPATARTPAGIPGEGREEVRRSSSTDGGVQALDSAAHSPREAMGLVMPLAYTTRRLSDMLWQDMWVCHEAPQGRTTIGPKAPIYSQVPYTMVRPEDRVVDPTECTYPDATPLKISETLLRTSASKSCATDDAPDP